MLRKISFLVMIVLALGLNLHAQSPNQVNLKNGSIIRGEIVSIVPDGNITINDLSGNTWVYPMSEVKEIIVAENEAGYRTSAFSPGFANMTSVGFLIGSQSSYYMAPFSMLSSFGYNLNADIYTGLLTGLEFIDVIHVPLMFDFQYSLMDGNVNPVLIARGGYTFPTRGEYNEYGGQFNYSGGIVGAIGVSLKFRSKDLVAWDVSMLYRYMQINYTQKYEYQPYTNSYTDIYNRLELRVGFYIGN